MKHSPKFFLTVLAAVTLALTGCTDAADWSQKTNGETALPDYDHHKISPQPEIAALLPEDIVESGQLIVAASTDYAPAEFLDSSGNPIGYDVDFNQALGRVLGLETTTESAAFDSIITNIGSKYDIGISSFSITSDREATVNMISYINVGSMFNVPAGNPQNLDVSDHLNLCGHTIGVQVGTAQESAMLEDAEACEAAGRDSLEVRSYSTQSEATTGLVGHVIDATYSDSTVAGYAVKQTGGAVITVGELEAAAPQGIVVPQDEEELTQALQAATQYLIDEGYLEEIYTAWGLASDSAIETAELNPLVD